MWHCDAHQETDAAIEGRADALHSALDKLLRDLVEMREHHELSQAEVAARMGVTQPTVSALERHDANPTISTIRRYALAVGATLDITVTDDLERGTINREFAKMAAAMATPARSWDVGASPSVDSISPISWRTARHASVRA